MTFQEMQILRLLSGNISIVVLLCKHVQIVMESHHQKLDKAGRCTVFLPSSPSHKIPETIFRNDHETQIHEISRLETHSMNKFVRN